MINNEIKDIIFNWDSNFRPNSIIVLYALVGRPVINEILINYWFEFQTNSQQSLHLPPLQPSSILSQSTSSIFDKKEIRNYLKAK